jgi:TPR repeat protein
LCRCHRVREKQEGLVHACPFCRYPTPATQAEVHILIMKRVKVNDPIAICFIGTQRYEEGDHEGAIAYWTQAAELGHAEAHFQLSTMYSDGIGVDQDEIKELHHLTEAAISGHPDARGNLAVKELRKGRYERAAKHLIIAANLGHDTSVGKLRILYERGIVCREDFATALRAHQAAVDATKSPQREAAEVFFQNMV